MSKQTFFILDSTLREGVQSVHPQIKSSGVIFSPQQSKEIINALVNFGVDVIEIGSPIDSPTTEKIIKYAIANSRKSKSQIAVHCRLNPIDLEQAIRLQPDIIHVYFNSSDHSAYKSTLSPDMIGKLVSKIIQTNPKLKIRYSFEDAFRTNQREMFKIIDILKPHVYRFGFPDTTGRADPKSVNSFVTSLRLKFPNIKTEFHFHNDRYLAAANAREAVLASTNCVIDTTIMGLGERNGIVSLAGIVAALIDDENLFQQIENNYHLEKMREVYQLVSNFTKIPIPLTEPIVGPTFFSHSCGVHVDGLMKNTSTYEHFSPTQFGYQTKICWASAVVGKANILFRAKQLNINLSTLEAQIIAAQIREKAKRSGIISASDVDLIIKEKSKQ